MAAQSGFLKNLLGNGGSHSSSTTTVADQKHAVQPRCKTLRMTLSKKGLDENRAIFAALQTQHGITLKLEANGVYLVSYRPGSSAAALLEVLESKHELEAGMSVSEMGDLVDHSEWPDDESPAMS